MPSHPETPLLLGDNEKVCDYLSLYEARATSNQPFKLAFMRKLIVHSDPQPTPGTFFYDIVYYQAVQQFIWGHLPYDADAVPPLSALMLQAEYGDYDVKALSFTE